MASGLNLWVWLECIGVVSGCRKEVYRYPLNKLLLFPIATPLVLAFFGSSIPTSLFNFKMFFRSCKNKNKKNKKDTKGGFFTSRGAQVNCAITAMLYSHWIGNQL